MLLFERFVPERLWRRLRPDAVAVWSDPEVRRRLSWYYRVMRDEAPAKFMIARSVEVDEDPWRLDYEGLQDLKKSARRVFESLLREARRGELTLEALRKEFRSKPRYTLLHVDAVLAWRLANPCRLCERRCMIDRSRRIGACRLDSRVYVHSWFHHLGEEAPLVPSGTIFYGGCNFTCVYCQNHDVSQTAARRGEAINARKLAWIQKMLRVHGARNINHVGGEPTPSLPVIVESLLHLDVNVPQIWNSNMYMTPEALDILVDIVDLWLPDFKYGNDRCAMRLSAVPRYFEVVTRNLRAAVEWADMIIRHLVLPSHVECCSIPVLRWIAENLPRDRVLVNIMDQYRPEHLVARYPRRWPEIARTPTREEIERVYEYARRLGLVFEPVS
ncbi:pyruvate formate lyase-activating protein [Pyrodictium occultum]|uniref:Pyruvate formate lyase-activating protein n=1 Tax=Pyrodictium occultum TaxID=2309 RepID=A0A0V8RW77_PYROC|nr:radical SAM protein [Pyrodictium occultum]KSW12310.1 pyruvate formate lyase-activating protein [Pyrodictium occultum]